MANLYVASVVVAWMFSAVGIGPNPNTGMGPGTGLAFGGLGTTLVYLENTAPIFCFLLENKSKFD